MNHHFTPLTRDQISRLCAMAGQAYKAAKARGQLDDDLTLEQFRREGQMEVCGKSSLKDCRQPDFLQIRGKWHVVLGNLEQAFYDFLNAEPENEARKQMCWRLAGQLNPLFEHFLATNQVAGQPITPAEAGRRAWTYLEACSKGKQLQHMTAQEIEHLGYTLTNRTNAMRGVGSPKTRNKSQRRKKQSSPLSPPSGNRTTQREITPLPTDRENALF
jgi:hypothetical protein